ncbi:MAG: hypothetical protein K1X86_11735 [Ignavibacteria bacterium]|nr:hypothetical protein [Ignavibacteria bacterium]
MKEKILTIDEFYKSETLTPAFVENIREFEEVVYEMVKVMNHIHNTNRSYRFWKLIVIDFVNYKLQRKKELSEKVVSSSQGLKTAAVQNLIYSVKSFQNRKSLETIKHVLENYDNIAHGFHDAELIEKEIGKLIPSYFPIILQKGDVNKRERANKLAETYTNNFYKNIILQLPKAFVEHFDHIYNLYPLVNPEKKAFHVSFIVSEYVKILVAKYVEHGAKLLFYQHGGGGGEIKDRSIFHDSSVSDNYVTWGWKIDPNQIPGKAYRCHGFRKRFESYDNEVLYDCTLAFNLIGESDKKFFKPITDYFLANIDLKKYPRILGRPRPVRKLGSLKSQLDFIQHPNVSIDSGKTDMAYIIAHSKILVTFKWVWPQTVFTESAYVDHPAVAMVIDLDCSTVFKPYYDFFLEQKVFHDTIESLVEHLNTVNIDDWWGKIIQHPMYKAYKNEFLRQV